MAASVGLDRKLERSAKRGGDTFHPVPLTVTGIYALHVSGLASLAIFCLCQFYYVSDLHGFQCL